MNTSLTQLADTLNRAREAAQQAGLYNTTERRVAFEAALAYVALAMALPPSDFPVALGTPETAPAQAVRY